MQINLTFSFVASDFKSLLESFSHTEVIKEFICIFLLLVRILCFFLHLVWSFLHLKFILMYGEKYESNFIFFQMTVQDTICLKFRPFLVIWDVTFVTVRK